MTRVSIHAPRVGCDISETTLRRAIRVSIHAPRVGCDGGLINNQYAQASFNSRTPCGVRLSWRRCINTHRLFQFTLPVWGATSTPPHGTAQGRVSIHAPRVGCDGRHDTAQRHAMSRFNSRTPCGVRLSVCYVLVARMCFNSRTPCGVRLGFVPDTCTS